MPDVAGPQDLETNVLSKEFQGRRVDARRVLRQAEESLRSTNLEFQDSLGTMLQIGLSGVVERVTR
jgi:hypothetical protein